MIMPLCKWLAPPWAIVALSLAGTGEAAGQSSATAIDLPVKIPSYPGVEVGVRNPITWRQLHAVSAGASDNEGEALWIDLGDSALQGTASTGPYPFEAGKADYAYQAFRLTRPVTGGTGILRIDRFFEDKFDANQWPQGQCAEHEDCPSPTIAYRLHLLTAGTAGRIVDYGFYDGRAGFTGDSEHGPYRPAPTIIEGPFVNLVRSDTPDRVLISFETDAPCLGSVVLREKGKTFREPAAMRRHAVWLTDLKADTAYTYQARCDGDAVRSMTYALRTAPPVNGSKKVVFAFASDSREGVGGGERRLMGHNARALGLIANDAYRRGAEMIVFAGDLVNGYTTSKDDFRLQLKAWKKTLAGFWRHHPVYAAMGNHESLLNAFRPDDPKLHFGIEMDKWPYATDSAEAVFADEFWNPDNGPAPSDPRRPSYKETVYTMRYGPVLFISFDNTYWSTTAKVVGRYGGSPGGYILADQLAWVERRLEEAETDDTIKFVFLYAHEPAFPAGGHVKDAMWWRGDNNVRAYVKNNDGMVVAAGPGIIEVRNRLWKAIARSTKVAAVLAGHEHAYHRIRIDDTTPVGVYPADDTDGDGVLDRFSPDPDFVHPTWQITAGNAGAPWYARQKTPWNVDIFSSQSGYVLFTAGEDGVSMTVYGLTGQVLDHIDNLMAIK
jgi:hypothetical protein